MPINQVDIIRYYLEKTNTNKLKILINLNILPHLNYNSFDIDFNLLFVEIIDKIKYGITNSKYKEIINNKKTKLSTVNTLLKELKGK